MRRATAAFALLILTIGAPRPSVAGPSFAAWKAEFGKVYASDADEASAKAAFLQNSAIIARHNRSYNSTHTLGLNSFSDLTPEAWASRFRTLEMTRPQTGAFPPSAPPTDVGALPSAWDWREHGAVAPVQNQGGCGGCYAFSCAAALEGALAIATKQPVVKLSEEDLLECATPPNVLCAGGDIYKTFQWTAKDGISTEKSYPYTSANGGASACNNARWGRQAAWNAGGVVDIHDVPGKGATEAAMRAALAGQPMSAGVNGAALQHYKGGILTLKDCAAEVNHAALIVGWGSERGVGYWTVKNSWGTAWGESGYFRVARAPQPPGACALQYYVAYPTGLTTKNPRGSSEISAGPKAGRGRGQTPF
jgi:hypothetical protein